MPNYAQATIIGHLGRDVESKSLPDGKAIANFSVATTRKVKGEEMTTWWRVATFGRTAEIAQQYLRKGSPVLITGEPSLREYTTKEGEKRSVLEINADKLTLLGSRNDSQSDARSERPAAKSEDFPSSAGDLEEIPF